MKKKRRKLGCKKKRESRGESHLHAKKEKAGERDTCMQKEKQELRHLDEK